MGLPLTFALRATWQVACLFANAPITTGAFNEMMRKAF
jgi:hypothetical protein